MGCMSECAMYSLYMLPYVLKCTDKKHCGACELLDCMRNSGPAKLRSQVLGLRSEFPPHKYALVE